MKQIIIFILLFVTFYCYGKTAKVTRVIDGDTFMIETSEKVRLIGINAPEISDIFGQEAKQYLSYLILNKSVSLQADNISKNRDQYQRLLRYVILDGVDINQKMLSEGFAFAYLKYKFSKSIEYTNAQLEAKEFSRGIWGDNKKEKVTHEQKEEKKSFWQGHSPKTYVVSSLLIILLITGLYAYIKK